MEARGFIFTSEDKKELADSVKIAELLNSAQLQISKLRNNAYNILTILFFSIRGRYYMHTKNW